MKNTQYDVTKKHKNFKSLVSMITMLCLVAALFAGCANGQTGDDANVTTAPVATEAPTQPTEAPTEPTEPPIQWETGLVSAVAAEVSYCDSEGAVLGTLIRGAEVLYTTEEDGTIRIQVDGVEGYLQDASVVSDAADLIPAHTLYVRSAVNLRDVDGRLLYAFADKGAAVEVIGYDYLEEDGQAHMYQVILGEEEGYIMPWYVVDTEEGALANYDVDGSYTVHANRGNSYGGGNAATLDYYPREKGPIEGNDMPEECRTLYLNNWCFGNLESYIEIANNSGINAFVVDILDGGSVGYAGEVMKEYCPKGARYAQNTVEEFQAVIQRLKDEGYYVIGRISTFNDSYYVSDHPENALTNWYGDPLKLAGDYWPSAYSRQAWQYKVDLAVEAVELMGFNEIQFDYVRFPDSTWSYDNAGTIDYHNTYGETKAQAIQRFLMYATDILREKGVYVSADVFGESAYTYVTAYGQYWPAISNVVDVISGMPYPDHFGKSGDYIPWEHPYATLYNWGTSVVKRQAETATPAAVRTWIQAYNAIYSPNIYYGPDQVFAQIEGLRDSGCTGGYMTWNSLSSVSKYQSLMPAFTPPEEE